MGKKVEQIARNPKTNADDIKRCVDVSDILTGKRIYDSQLMKVKVKDPDQYIYIKIFSQGAEIRNIIVTPVNPNIKFNGLYFNVSSGGCTIGRCDTKTFELSSFINFYNHQIDFGYLDNFDGSRTIRLRFPSTSTIDYLALISDIPTYYQHTIILTSSTNPNIMFTFTTPKKDNTDINSLTDLISKFGNTSIQGMGSDGTNTLAYLHIGTSATDTYFKTTTNQQVTLANSGFTNVADEVTTIS